MSPSLAKLQILRAPRPRRVLPRAASLGQPVLPRKGQEDRQTQLRLNVVGEAGPIRVPGLAVLGVGPGCPEPLGDLRVLELVEEDVIADLKNRREPAVEEDANASSRVERDLGLEIEGAV